MKLLKPGFVDESNILAHRDEWLQLIERAGRTCYKSEGKMTLESAPAFVRKIIQVKKHESVIEHVSISVRFTIDRGVSHELVRHRIAAYSQESTRYVNYAKESGCSDGHCQFVIPPWTKLPEGTWEYPGGSVLAPPGGTGYYQFSDDTEKEWVRAMSSAEKYYLSLSKLGWSPQQARSVLPNATKTEVFATYNLREWRHVFRMRTAEAAHPQMREVTRPLLAYFKLQLPEVFDDITN